MLKPLVVSSSRRTLMDSINNAFNTPHNENDVGDKVIKSLLAKWDLTLSPSGPVAMLFSTIRHRCDIECVCR